MVACGFAVDLHAGMRLREGLSVRYSECPKVRKCLCDVPMCNKQITVMKKFFRMVTALSLVAGVLAFSGCTDYEDDINALNERVDGLVNGDIADLKTQLETQKSELTNAINAAKEEAKEYADAAAEAAKKHADAVAASEAADALAEAKTYADQALASAKEYADAAAAKAAATVKAEMLEEIASQVETVLADAKEYADMAATDAAEEALNAAKTYVDEQVLLLSGRINAVDESINTLKESLAGVEKTLGEHAEKLAALETFKTQAEADLKTLKEFQTSTESKLVEISESLGVVNQKLAELGSKDAALEKAINDLKEEYAEKMQEIDSAIEALNGYIEDLNADIEEINGNIADIVERLDSAEERLDGIDSLLEGLDGRISDAENRLDAIEEDIKEINANILALSQQIGKRVTSISLIPELYVDGVPAISFPTIVYNPLQVVDELSVVAGDEYYAEPFGNTIVRYNLSPSHVTKDGIASAEYLVERAEMITKAYVENNLISVNGYEVNDRNELEVTISGIKGISRLNLTDNQLDETYYHMLTAALQLGIADELLLEGESDAYVTSEYSAVLERPYQLHISPIFDLNQEIEKYSCGNRRLVKFSTTYDDAKEARPSVTKDYDSEINLLDLVTSCAHAFTLNDGEIDKFFKEDCQEIDKERMAELGFAFRFALPETYAIQNEGTNEQEFAMFKAGSDNTVLVSTYPDNPNPGTPNKAAIGRTPIVRVELIDLNNDNAIVDVQWLKVKWTEQEIPETDCELIKTFDYTVSCEGFEGTVNWNEVNTLILAKVGENGIDHETFESTYWTGSSEEQKAHLKWNSEDYAVADTDIEAVWTWGNQDIRTTVFTWNLTVDQIGDVADDILASDEGYITYTVDVTLNPRPEKADYAGAIKFQLAVRIHLPELPAVYGYEETYWNKGITGDLALVTPVGYEEAVVQGGNADATVDFNYSLWNLFNPEPETSNLVTLMNPEDDELEEAWACREWDMQFSANQTLDGYAPGFVPDKFAGADGKGYRFYYEGTEVTSMYGSAQTPWYRDVQIADFRVNLKNNEGGIALLNDIDNITKKVAVDIWARLNKHNVVKVHTYDIAYINPLKLVAPKITGSFTDAHNTPSSVAVNNAFDGLKDFQGHPVNTGNDRARYYGVKNPVWKTDAALVNIVLKQNENGGYDKVVDKTLDGTKAEDRAKMMKLTQANYNLELTSTNLTFRNNSGSLQSVEQTIWIPVVFEHKYGKIEYWVKIPIKPNDTTPTE